MVELRSHADPFRVAPEICRGRDRIIRVADGKLDLAIVTHDRLQIEAVLRTAFQCAAELTIEPLSRQPFCVATKKNSAVGREMTQLPEKRRVALRLFSRWNFVVLDPQSGIRVFFESLVRAAGQPVRFVPATGTGGWTAGKGFARRGVVGALLPWA